MNRKIILIPLSIGFMLQVFCLTTGNQETETPKETPRIIQEPKSIDSPKEEVDLSSASRWNKSYYKEHDIQSFQKIGKVNTIINFKSIDYPLLNAAIFYETNRRRIEMSLPALEYSPALEKAAILHSIDMVKLDFYSHTSPVAGRETPRKRMEVFGIRNAYTAENINIGFGIAYEGGRPVYTPAQNKGNFFSYDFNGIPLPPQTYRSLSVALVDSWMNSPGHRRNILNTNLKYMGIGTYHFKDAKFFGMDKFKATQKFSSMKGAIPSE